MNLPFLARLVACPILMMVGVSCQSMEALKKGDVIGGLIGAPFELAAGAVDTATMPLSGQKPAWVRDAEIASMKAGKPKLNDPAWVAKFDKELKAGEIYLATFDENLEAYRISNQEKYLGRAEQLCVTQAERSKLEEQVLKSLGNKAFDIRISIDGQTTKPKYSERTSQFLFISGTTYGAVAKPRGNASISLRNDLPFSVKDSYRVEVKFKFVIPRESTMVWMGMQNTTNRDSVGVVTKQFTFGPNQRTASATLDFGTLNGAGTVSVLGGVSKIELTDPPYSTYEIVQITKI